MASSPEKVRAYRPLLAALVAELLREYDDECQRVEQASAAGDNSAPAAPEGETSS